VREYDLVVRYLSGISRCHGPNTVTDKVRTRNEKLGSELEVDVLQLQVGHLHPGEFDGPSKALRVYLWSKNCSGTPAVLERPAKFCPFKGHEKV